MRSADAPRRLHRREQILVVERRAGPRRASRVITTTWPRVAGLMSITVTVRSSESTTSLGISPATTLQKMQSGSAHARKLIDGRATSRFTMLRAPDARRQPALRPPRRHLVERRLGAQPAAHQHQPGTLRLHAAGARPRRSGIDPQRLAVLDVGCGGGLLAEEFARLGCRVTGIDPSAESLEAARGARSRGVASRSSTWTGAGEQLPFPGRVVRRRLLLRRARARRRPAARARRDARVLKPGGVYIYDTINRTRRSKLVMIKLFQEWNVDRHDGAEPARLGHVHQTLRPRVGPAKARGSKIATSWASARAVTRSRMIRDMRTPRAR